VSRHLAASASGAGTNGDGDAATAEGGAPRRSRLRRHLTVRAKATLAATVMVAVTLVLGAVALRVLLRQALVGNLEAAARVRAAELIALVRHDDVPDQLAVHADEDALTQIVGPNGEVQAASTDLDGAAPLGPVPASDGARPFTVHLGPTNDPDVFRVVVATVGVDGGTTTVFVGSNMDRIDETVQTATRIVTIGVPLLVGIVAVTTWFLVGRALRPVELIRAEVADISEGDLHRRVPEPATDDEVGRLARTMNATLERLAESAERQRRFVADASHELQSPVAAAQTVLDVAMAHPDEADWPQVADDVREEHQRIERLVRDMLFLARREGGASPLVVAPVDLDDIVGSEAARLHLRPGLRMDLRGVEPVELQADGDQLARVVRNLLENARQHAARTITVTTRQLAGDAELVVADDGPGVPAADRERIFDRFARTDAARDRRHGGTGLGLAIVRDIVQAHGGTIILADSDGGARFIVRLPLTPATPLA
jgi:signal transduction histidine kinase